MALRLLVERMATIRPWLRIVAVGVALMGAHAPALGQDGAFGDQSRPAEESAAEHGAPARVDVASTVEDAKIAGRLQRILTATGWFEDQDVRVDEGVAFLSGATNDQKYRDWAGDLAGRTEGVVAVVNRIEVELAPLSRWGPAVEGLSGIWSGFLHALPGIALGALLLIPAFVLARVVTALVRARARRPMRTDIVRELTARAAGLAVFVLGLYLALRVGGLTRLAATVLGGTGIVGLVLGIAFRDIAENVLASILLTRQRPFRKGDLVEIAGVEGYVQRLTVRATVLMNLEGNHVQIPNSTVYKGSIRNYTSNPTRRVEFLVGIGYRDSIARAQDVALSVIAEHPAVLRDPEPWVLAEALGSATVQLRVYVWLDGTKHSWLKVRSSVIRLVKRAFQQHGITMPDEAREVVFPDGVPVRLVGRTGSRSADGQEASPPADQRTPAPVASSEELPTVATSAEAGLDSDAGHIGRLAEGARSPEEGPDLLGQTPPHS